MKYTLSFSTDIFMNWKILIAERLLALLNSILQAFICKFSFITAGFVSRLSCFAKEKNSQGYEIRKNRIFSIINFLINGFTWAINLIAGLLLPFAINIAIIKSIFQADVINEKIIFHYSQCRKPFDMIPCDYWNYMGHDDELLMLLEND